MTITDVQYGFFQDVWGYLVTYSAQDSEALARGNGIVGTDTMSGWARNAFAHTLMSAKLTYEYGRTVAEKLGSFKEYVGSGTANDTFKDQYNNEVGRRIGEYVATLGLQNDTDVQHAIDDLIVDAYINGHLIVDENNDPRISAGASPTWSGPVTTIWQNISLGRDYTDVNPNENIQLFLEKKLIENTSWIQTALAKFGVAEAVISPLVLDLDGDGIELTSLTGTGAAPVYWDVDNDGFREASAWVAADDGLLVLDQNGNGTIDNHSELFGTDTTDGFTILSAHDSNGDDKITSADTVWSSLRVWQDTDQDGISDAGELHTLDNLGIGSINLNSTAVDYSIAGNSISDESIFTLTDNTTRAIVDAWFAYDNVNSVDTRDYTLDIEALMLPQLRGYGEVSDLYIAVSRDSTLKDMVSSLANVSSEDIFSPEFDFDGSVRDLLFRWAGVDEVPIDSRGSYIDARELAFLEALFGQDFLQTGGLTNPVTFSPKTEPF